LASKGLVNIAEAAIILLALLARYKVTVGLRVRLIDSEVGHLMETVPVGLEVHGPAYIHHRESRSLA
jgi:hypothetical protein